VICFEFEKPEGWGVALDFFHVIVSPGIEPGYIVFPSQNNYVQFYLAYCYLVKN
jgi:hypothetical protein